MHFSLLKAFKNVYPNQLSLTTSASPKRSQKTLKISEIFYNNSDIFQKFSMIFGTFLRDFQATSFHFFFSFRLWKNGLSQLESPILNEHCSYYPPNALSSIYIRTIL